MRKNLTPLLVLTSVTSETNNKNAISKLDTADREVIFVVGYASLRSLRPLREKIILCNIKTPGIQTKIYNLDTSEL